MKNKMKENNLTGPNTSFLLFLNVYLFLIGYFYLHCKYYPPSQFPLSKPPIPSSLHTASMKELTHPTTYSCLTALVFAYTEASSLHRTKGLPSH